MAQTYKRYALHHRIEANRDDNQKKQRKSHSIQCISVQEHAQLHMTRSREQNYVIFVDVVFFFISSLLLCANPPTYRLREHGEHIDKQKISSKRFYTIFVSIFTFSLANTNNLYIQIYIYISLRIQRHDTKRYHFHSLRVLHIYAPVCF